jgi:hypothetical protein
MRLHRTLVFAVIDSLNLIFNEGKYADKVVEKVLKRDKRWGSRDRKFIAETIYEMVRWKRLYNEIAGTKEHYTTENLWKNFTVWAVLKGYELPDWTQFVGTPSRRIKGKFDELQKERKFKETKPPKAPRVWIGYIFALVLLIVGLSEIVIETNSRFDPIAFSIGLAGMLYWLFCVQRFHQILNTLTIDGYSISPGKAVGFHFIPFFNLYWIFKWPIELSKFVNKIGKVKMISGAFLGLILLISIFIYRQIDGSIGLVCVYSVGLYINNKIKKTYCRSKTKRTKMRKENKISQNGDWKNINKKQKTILLICATVLFLMLLWPPFHSPLFGGQNMGYGFLFYPPSRGSLVATVNVTTLSIQFIAVTLIGGILFVAFKK